MVIENPRNLRRNLWILEEEISETLLDFSKSWRKNLLFYDSSFPLIHAFSINQKNEEHF
jgi:hypothetical protein